MQSLELKQVEHDVKIGQECPEISPNVTSDTLFTAGGEVVGFYLRDVSKTSEIVGKLADLANHELRSDRVPKSTMHRIRRMPNGEDMRIEQYSTIIGSIPPKPHMRRPYPQRSSVHGVETANNFVKAMSRLCFEAEEVIKAIAPELFHRQLEIIEKNVPEKWRFGRLYTSSISNYNISAPFHRDAANLENTVNIIISKKHRAYGGDLHVPDYGLTIESRDNSMLVYPAWRNVHGVTPIQVHAAGGYRNSLVFYPLKAFEKFP